MANQRRRGCNYERLIVNELKELGFKAVTSRAESRNMDASGVDVFTPITSDIKPSEILPVHIQCKNSKLNPKYDTLLTENRLPVDKDTVVFHRKTKKATTKFVSQGDYVIMKKETFYKLIR